MVWVWFAIVIPVLSVIFFFNLYIDPLWCFSHSNRWNNHQPGFSERQQKTNRIYFTELEKYDTLMLGSSRTAYINQYDFHGMKVFNYAADNMLPWEYEQWIEIATRIKGAPFKHIIIGIDFFGTAENYDPVMERYYHGKKAKDYLFNTLQPLYRLKALLNFDSIRHSINSIRFTLHPTISDYDRRNVRHCNIVVSEKEKARYIQRDIREYQTHLSNGQYRYRTSWPYMIHVLKGRYPKTRFIFFTTPVSQPFFEKIVLENGRVDDYKRWLTETVNTAGKLYHFMDLNSVTTSLENFFDAHHMYAKGVAWVAHRISGYRVDTIPPDFGKVLTPESIDDYFNQWQETYDPSR